VAVGEESPTTPAAAASSEAGESRAAGAGTAGALDVAAIRRVWPEVLGRVFTMRRVTWTFVSQHAQVLDYDGQRLLLGIATTGLTQTFRAGNHAEVVRQALIDEVGLDVRVEGVAAADHAPAPSAAPAPQPDDAAARQTFAAPTAPAAPSAPAASTGPTAPTAPTVPAVPTVPTGSPSAAPAAAARPPMPPPAAPPSPPAHAPATAPPPAARRPDAEAAATHPPTDRADQAHTHADSVRHELARAKEATRRSLEAKHSGGARHTAPRPPEDEVSLDDEDLDVSADMGQAVIERLLGGQVVQEFEE